MAGGSVQPGPQALRPPGYRNGPLGGRNLAVPRSAAIGRYRRAGTLIDHPAQHISRVHGELQFQQLVQHFLLAAAQDGVIADTVARDGQEMRGGTASTSSTVSQHPAHPRPTMLPR